MTLSWPDGPAATKAGSTVRDQLDYVVWICEAIEPIGFHSAPDLESWRRRVQTAFSALIDSMTPGHGDPLPPDVPPSLRPGQWPDVPAYSVPGMTVRHQLTVLRTIAGNSRTNQVFPRSPAEVAAWTAHVQTAYDALDHGAAMAMPAAYRTAPPPPPVKRAPAPKKAAPKKAGAASGRKSARVEKKPPAPKKIPARKAASTRASARKTTAGKGKSKR